MTSHFGEYSNKTTLHDFLGKELDYMVARGYSEVEENRKLRPIIIAYAEQYAKGLRAPLLPMVAVNYADRFLSRKQLPVLKSGFGTLMNTQIFVMACVTLACRAFDRRVGEIRNIVNAHLKEVEFADIIHIETVIQEALDSKMEPMTSLHPLVVLLDLAKLDNKPVLPSLRVQYIVSGIHKDINFTQYKLSTIAASAILATSDTLEPTMHHLIEKNILGSGLVNEVTVKRCFAEMKTHAVVDHVLKSHKCPRQSGGADRKGKEPMVDNWRAEVRVLSVKDFDLEWLGAQE